MQDTGSLPSEQQPAILVVSGPQDEQAIALVQALRQAGLRAIFAETVTLAARQAGEAAACVAVLRQDTWKAQTIAVVMRARPACFIPVLAEAMPLPRGPWTHAAITLSEIPEQGTQELLQTLRAYLARSAPSKQHKSKQNELTSLNMVRIKPLRRSRRVGAFLTTLLLVLLILSLGGLLGYRYSHPPTTVSTTTTNPLASSLNNVYSTLTPGPDCDTRGGQWEQGEHYVKTVDKKKVEVIDKYTTLQCQATGALLTRSGDYEVYSELFFDGPALQNSLAPHYLAQVTATIVSGDAQANVTIDAHIHNYGRYNFDVNTLGHWEASIGNTTDGDLLNRLAIGFLQKKSKTYMLAIDVNGPTMTFWINGTQVTSVTDTTYTDNDSVAFGIADGTASSPVTALFSNFKYEVLPSTLTPAQQAATATATDLPQRSPQAPYTARIPGYGCDKGAGQWQPLADRESAGSLHCLANGMQLTSPANSKTIAEEEFYWLNGHFPQNYRVSAQIDVSAANDGCAGLATREQADSDSYGSYEFVICSDGSWTIALNTTKFQMLAQGTVQAQNVYTITAESKGSAQSLYINGQLIQTVKDTHLTKTDHLALEAGLYNSSQETIAIFSHFLFTPLP